MARKPVPAKKKPSTATDDSQEGPITTIDVNKQVEGDSKVTIDTHQQTAKRQISVYVQTGGFEDLLQRIFC